MKKHAYWLTMLFILILCKTKVCAQELTPLPDVIESDGKLGICFSHYDDGARASQAYKAGSRWDRFDFRWDVIQPAAGDFNTSAHHNVVDNIELPNHLNVVGILWATPTWAACSAVASQSTLQAYRASLPAGYLQQRIRNADPGSRIPCNLNLSWNNNENYWGQYVYHIVNEFKDTVHVWELWNEPDRPDFWAGTPEQYAQMLKVGYQAIKAADPSATVLFGGLAYWGNPNFHNEVLIHLLATDPQTLANNSYFDVMSLHLYSNAYHNHTISAQIMSEVTSRVGWHPLWLTETGVPIWDEKTRVPPQYYDATAEEAAAYVIQAFAGARAAGVDKFFFFRMHDEEGMSGGPQELLFGLTRNDYSIRPSYLAYQVTARYLRAENQVTGPFSSNSGAYRITFWGTPMGRVDVLWNTLGNATTVYTHPAILPTATLINHRGQTQTLTANNGYFTLSLAPATANLRPDGIYMIGGPPLLLLQEDTESPTSALHQPPADFYTDSITLNWEAGDAESGYWYEEIQRATTPTGPWELAAGWDQTNGVTQAKVLLPFHGSVQTWYFRARARDKAGHWEAWPEMAEVDSSFSLTQTVTLTVTVGTERPQTILLPIPSVTIQWRTPDGTVIAQTVQPFSANGEEQTLIIGEPWVVTATTPVGVHHLYITQADHLPVNLSFWVTPGTKPQAVTIHHILRLTRASVYLPIVLKQHKP
ncbi:MAG: cellulase family glycosylhydrolase [Anaerolineae bacterium]|nr:cellulase family glycosylhydrolase [Anaerolineae bacterium]